MQYSGRPILSKQLQEWYHIHARKLPWRNTKDAYSIWLSEVILQQTRVAQGLPYYIKFLETFPTLQSLATASEDQVLELWQGLGYYSRGRNLLSSAIQINEQMNGQMPSNSTDLMKIKGIGPYTAAAVASFAFSERIAVADGNVFRVLARLFAIADDIALQATQNMLRGIATQILPELDGQVSTHNQAIMELGALVCTPKNPTCTACPLQSDCMAFALDKTAFLPFKSRLKEKKIRYLTYIIVVSDKKIAMKKRKEGDIWQGLYDFWLLEQENKPAFDGFGFDMINSDIDEPITFKTRMGNTNLAKASQPYRHQLTHQTLFIQFYTLQIDADTLVTTNLPDEYQFYSIKQIEKLPKPIMIKNYLQSLEFFSIFGNDL